MAYSHLGLFCDYEKIFGLYKNLFWMHRNCKNEFMSHESIFFKIPNTFSVITQSQESSVWIRPKSAWGVPPCSWADTLGVGDVTSGMSLGAHDVTSGTWADTLGVGDVTSGMSLGVRDVTSGMWADVGIWHALWCATLSWHMDTVSDGFGVHLCLSVCLSVAAWRRQKDAMIRPVQPKCSDGI